MKHIFPLLIILSLFTSCEKKKESESAKATFLTRKPSIDTLKPLHPADSAKIQEYVNSKEDCSYIIVEWCQVYEDTALTKKAASLPFATPVKVLTALYDEVPLHIQNTWQHKVLLIQFPSGHDEDSLIGYVYETDLSFFAAKASDGNLILAGFDNFETSPLTGKLIVVDTLNRMMDKVSFPMIGGYENESGIKSFGYYTEGKITFDHVASGFRDLLSIYLYYPACGYMATEQIFNYHNQRLTPIASCNSGSDAGYYHAESYLIFPDEPKGKPNHIFKVDHSVEYEFDENEEYKVLNDDSLLVQLKWDMDKGVIKADTVYNNFDN